MTVVSLPLTYFEQNLIVTDKRAVWALYKLEPWHYEHLSASVRLGLLWRLSRLFWELEEYAGQVLIIPRTQQARERLTRLKSELDGPLAETAASFADDVAAQLAGARDGVVYDYYLALRLPHTEPAPGSREFWKDVWRQPHRLVDEVLGLRQPGLMAHEIAAYLEREEVLYGRLSRVVQAARATPYQTAWLIRRGFWRGIGEPSLRPDWAPDALALPSDDGAVELRPELSAIRTLTEGEMDLSHPRRIAMTQQTANGDAKGLSAFCFVADLPDEFLFPGSEWLFRLEDLPFPVEVVLRWENVSHEETLGAVRRKKLEILDQDDHTRRSGEDVPITLLDAQEQVISLEHDLKQRRFPMVHASICLVVSAPDERTLQDRIHHVKAHCNAFQIRVEVPAGDQLQAFLGSLPGGPPFVSDYIHRVPPEVLAGSMFLGTQSLGDTSGPYVGKTGILRRPVYMDPSLPPSLNRSASVAFLGSLGGGKSFAANLLTYLAVLYRGAQALVLDPKGERTNWLTDLPELAGHLHIVTLGSSADDAGKLDPFIMRQGGSEEDLRETGNLAVSLLSFLGNVPTGDPRFLAIMQAVERVADQPQPALGKVITELEVIGREEPHVATLAAFYRALSRRAYANLIFGQGHERGLDLTHPMNVLQLQHLSMPPEGKPREEFSLEELLSVALMHAVTGFATHFTRRDRSTFKIVLFDEAWALMASSQGRTLVTQLLRTGRAMNNAVYLVSQNVADLLDETVKNNIGAKFIFRSFDQQEITKVLQFLNLEPEAENAAALRQLETGQALYQDLHGRVGILTIDPIFAHLRRAFDTRPGAQREEAGV